MTSTNQTKWSLILGIPAALAAITSVFTFVANKPFRCSITHLVGVESSFCEDKNNLFTVQLRVLADETREAINGAKVEFVGNGTPETQYTDKGGFTKAQIASIGDVKVRISAKGYPVQEAFIDLNIPQAITREFLLTKEGKPKVNDLPSTTSSVAVEPAKTPTPTSTSELTTSAVYKDKFMSVEASTSSVSNQGRTVIPVLIKNITEGNVYFAYNVRDIIRVTSNTAETTSRAVHGCGSDINSFDFVTLTEQQKTDPLKYTSISSNNNTSITVECDIVTSDSSRINRLNLTIPLIRLEDGKPKPVSVYLGNIPVNK